MDSVNSTERLRYGGWLTLRNGCGTFFVLNMYTYIYIYIYICICICIFVYIYIYIYIHMSVLYYTIYIYMYRHRFAEQVRLVWGPSGVGRDLGCDGVA